MDNRTPSQRFWAKVDVRGADECWPWTGHITTYGYGGFQSNNAHRFSYAEKFGPIPAGLVVDHQCHNLDDDCAGGIDCPHRRCVNPNHLRAVSNAENLASSRHTLSYAAINTTHCPAGHAYEGDNVGHDRTDRYCRTCKRESGRKTDAWRNAEKRRRYAELRAAGMTAKEAKSASKVKVAMHRGDSQDRSAVA